MDQCDCGAFIPSTCTSCPTCESVQPNRLLTLGKKVGMTIMGGATAVTLMACYGAPGLTPEFPPESDTCVDFRFDRDGDNHCGQFDCDESDSRINTSAADFQGDGIDQDCDGADGPAGTQGDAGMSDAADASGG